MVTSQVISFLYQSARPGIDYELTDTGGGAFISYWNIATLGQQPTQPTLDATLISAPFLLWLSTHGGDAAQTLRREAKEALNRVAFEEQLLRAVVAVAADEINLLRTWISDYKVQVAAATSLANLQSRVAGMAALSQRTLDQVRTAIATKIDAGTVDT